MGDEQIKVLLVEDNPGDAELIKEMLATTSDLEFDLEVGGELSEAFRLLGTEHFDVILLDLGLPDSQGVETLIRVRSRCSETPIVVLTGRSEENLGAAAIRTGAQDYLVKGNVDAPRLIRSICYSIERHVRQQEIQEGLEQERSEQGYRSLEEIARTSEPSLVSRAYGKVPLKESFALKFDEMVEHYAHLLQLALEQKEFRVKHNVSRELKKIAEEIGDLGSIALDVIDIHCVALDRIGGRVGTRRLRAFEEEGRFQVLRLMGFLADFYRRYFVQRFDGERQPSGGKPA